MERKNIYGKKKEIILYNPHEDTVFSDTVTGRIFRKTHSPGGKYSYLVKYCSERQGKLKIYVSKKTSLAARIRYLLLPRKLEIYLWCKFNNINTKNVQIIYSKQLMKLSNKYVLFGLLRSVFDSDFKVLKEAPTLKCFNMSHFALGYSKRCSKVAKKIDPSYLVSESNLFRNSSFFKKIIPSYKKDVIVMNFVPQQRFKKINPLSKRKNKCLATGTLVEFPIDKNFKKFYHLNTYQPIRKKIFYHKKELSPFIDSIINREIESAPKKNKKSYLLKFICGLYKFVFVKTKKEYFSIDIVKKYNDYRMAVIGEETELPGIGFTECMACGCAYIGQNLAFYKDMGLIPGKHFITYDGTLEDLKKKISYFQKNPKKLEKIAENGEKFIKNECNYKRVVDNFLKKIE